MSLDLTHGFLSETHIAWKVCSGVFSDNFLTRFPKHSVSASETSDLTLWFESPRLGLVDDGGPARVSVSFTMTARLSDRIDEARVTLNAVAPVVEHKFTVNGRQRVCPVADFSAVSADGLAMVSSDNAEYDAVVRSVLANLLRQERFAVGPLMADVGRRSYRNYFNVTGHQSGILAVFVSPTGQTPTPPAIDNQLFSDGDMLVLFPDDLVMPAVNTARQRAGLATLPAALNPNVTVNTFDFVLEHNHIKIAATGRASTEIIGIDVGADLSFTGFFQVLINADDTIKVHVIQINHDIDSPLLDVADFFSAGAITRLLEELVPETVRNLLGGFNPALPLDLFERSATGLSAGATHDSLLSIFRNGLGLRWNIVRDFQVEGEPPYIRGHRFNKEFHIAGCSFGDAISAANLRRFPTHQAAIRAGYDGCATCQPDFSVASFGTIRVLVTHPEGVEPGEPMAATAVYASDVQRFGIVLAPDPEVDEKASFFVDDAGVATHHSFFTQIVPAPWVLTLTCGSWSATETITVITRFRDATGTVQGEETVVRGTVGQVGLAVTAGQ